jgi:hypothetical protein
VVIWPVAQRAPATSPHPSLAHHGQWIRSHSRRYTQQGAAFRISNSVPPTALAPPTLKSKHVPTSVLRTYKIRHRLQNSPLHGTGAPHRAPPSVRTFASAANIQQTQVPSYMVVCRQHTKSTTTPPLKPTTNSLNKPYTTNLPWSMYLQTLPSPPQTSICSCGIVPHKHTPRTTTTPGAV